MSDDNIYIKDESHPIPDVDTCDIEAEYKNGGVDLVIVISSPLGDDFRSKKRLIEKIRNYLKYTKSELFFNRHGRSPSNTITITIRYHSETSEAIVKLFNDCRPWVEDNGATLIIKPI